MWCGTSSTCKAPLLQVLGALLKSFKLQKRWREALLLADAAFSSPRLATELMNVCAAASQWPTALVALGKLQGQRLEADGVAHTAAMTAAMRGAEVVEEEHGEASSGVWPCNCCSPGRETYMISMYIKII